MPEEDCPGTTGSALVTVYYTMNVSKAFEQLPELDSKSYRSKLWSALSPGRLAKIIKQKANRPSGKALRGHHGTIEQKILGSIPISGFIFHQTPLLTFCLNLSASQ